MSSTDTADEAGGEAIFSSDGLPPLAAPRAPKIASSVSSNKQGNDVLDSNNLVDPAAAVSIFSQRPKESAHEKLARLQREVSELEKEMQNEDVSKLAAELSSRLETGVNAQDNLTKLLDDHMKTKSDDKVEGMGVVYELYGGTVSSSGTTEERLLKLEQVIGGSASTPLLTRLEAIEHKMKRVNNKALEDASTRAKVIRSDLEAASKARSKLSSSTSSADNKTIAELHAQLIQLEGISEHLPALTHRLQQLAHLHVNGANVSSRLTESEASLTTVQGSLNNLGSSMEKVEQGMIESIKTMDSNLKKLEDKLS
mmetsp:Transcript_28197/g.46706  ORF Transcript_28197/g.46706 Transcript_28197/m.46706 type:complete len:312 (-) Transcript_28197:126-1061(-)|eukprot:CAMPEP_0119012776 /NCGR_PEP_ID=MMETSP1176-20130426/7543_1 /TAXON_ID=265551 /ORGANISM="Synedropsis recta cf, Strain CCMP1620" /LENGTH=311 /DNA_ID=CAMNT_0006965799 /DNA_START=73 /DNA_END=1008 /DNA_ORIENTATION=-